MRQMMTITSYTGFCETVERFSEESRPAADDMRRYVETTRHVQRVDDEFDFDVIHFDAVAVCYISRYIVWQGNLKGHR